MTTSTESLPFVAACDRCGFTTPAASEGDAVAAVLAHDCKPTRPTPTKDYVPAREKTPFGQFQLRRSHLKTEIPGARKHGRDGSVEGSRVELPDARPAPLPLSKMLGPCRTCTRPMQANAAGYRTMRPGVPRHHSDGRCEACSRRLKRAQARENAAREAQAADPAATAALPAAAFPPTEVLVAGLCAQADPEAWFPEKGGSTAAAKAICNGDDTRPPCPVREECLQWALANNERFGIWGGLSERERRRRTKARAGAA